MPEPRLFVNLEKQTLPYNPAHRGSDPTFAQNRWKENGGNCNGHYTYVVLPSNNPFDDLVDHVGRRIQVRVSQHLHHDTLAVGAAVHYAGTADFVNGILTAWSNHSGHYQPHAICLDQAPENFPANLFQFVKNDGSLAPIGYVNEIKLQ